MKKQRRRVTYTYYKRCDFCNKPVKNPVTSYRNNGFEVRGEFHIGCIQRLESR